MFCKRLHRARLGKSRKTFDQQIAVREQPDQHALDHMILAQHGLSNLRLQIEQGLARG